MSITTTLCQMRWMCRIRDKDKQITKHHGILHFTGESVESALFLVSGIIFGYVLLGPREYFWFLLTLGARGLFLVIFGAQGSFFRLMVGLTIFGHFGTGIWRLRDQIGYFLKDQSFWSWPNTENVFYLFPVNENTRPQGPGSYASLHPIHQTALIHCLKTH